LSGARRDGRAAPGECAYGQGQENRWRVSLIKGTPAKFIDFALAPDAETAEKQVAEEHKISDTLRDRLIAIRDKSF
jgi:hypothetical protein